MSVKKILVTGGAGYIGSHAVRHLLDHGYEVTVLDNLSHGHAEAVDPRAKLVRGSTGDAALVAETLRQAKIEAVMHFAADIEVGESVTNPGKYYENNFSNALSLLGAMRDTGVKKIVFSSTAAVYGNPEKTPIEEDQLRSPINPYGRSKMMTEMAIEDFSHAHGFGYAVLRYFNVAGAAPDSRTGEDHQPESHLIPRILLAALGSTPDVKIFGTDYPTKDGTCVRDYVHVMDLVAAHRLALEKIEEGKGNTFNLGSESGFSVREVIATCERVTGKKLIVKEEARRPGDPAVLVASSARIRRVLGWERKYPDLDTIVQHAWNWHTSRPQGYRTPAPARAPAQEKVTSPAL
jgi:UDP-glucose 4-epimerase